MKRLNHIIIFLVAFASANAQTTSTALAALDDVFSAAEKLLIETYFDNNRQHNQEQSDHPEKKHKAKKHQGKQFPPGLAKKDSLPPGLAKQLERNGTLPPGLAKRDLPAELERELPTLQEGRRRIIVDDDVVLIETVTETILDILFDVAGD